MKNIALITGASSGIGEALAIEHAKRQGDLILVARRTDKLNDIKKKLESKYNTSVTIITKDLSDRQQVQSLYDEVKQSGVTIDILINNAGFGGNGNFHERAWETDQKMIDVNINALSMLTHLFLNDMIKADKGNIMNVASVASYMPGPKQATYFATKAFVRSLSFAISEEIKNTNVHITTVCPGPTKSEFQEISDMNSKLFKNAKTSAQVAKEGYRAMEKKKRNIITDLQQAFLIKMLPFVPNSLSLAITHKMLKE